LSHRAAIKTAQNRTSRASAPSFLATPLPPCQHEPLHIPEEPILSVDGLKGRVRQLQEEAGEDHGPFLKVAIRLLSLKADADRSSVKTCTSQESK
jgi:hypothetical protein